MIGPGALCRIMQPVALLTACSFTLLAAKLANVMTNLSVFDGVGEYIEGANNNKRELTPSP